MVDGKHAQATVTPANAAPYLSLSFTESYCITSAPTLRELCAALTQFTGHDS